MNCFLSFFPLFFFLFFFLRRGLAQVCDEVIPILLLLEACKDHLCSRNVLLRGLEVVKERVLLPDDSRADVGLAVGVSRGLSGLASEEAVQVGSLLVATSRLDSVALRALGLENLGSFLCVTHVVFCLFFLFVCVFVCVLCVFVCVLVCEFLC